MKFTEIKNIKLIITIITCIAVVIATIIVVSIGRTKHSTTTTMSYATKEMDEQIVPDDNEEFGLPDKDTEISIEDLPEEDLEKANIDEEKNSDNNTSNNSKNKLNNTSSRSTTSNGKPYYIKVNYSANVVTVYSLDSSNNYTIPVKTMVCSTGRATPHSGKYKTSGRWRWIALFGGVYGQYSTRIVGNILFHSVPYLRNYDPASLEYWEYDKLGTSASAGCVRLSVIDAKWIYENIASGTIVEFYSSSNPGPLGKPSAKKISSNTECRNWDPTDPDVKNPWKNVVLATPTPISNQTTTPTSKPSPTTTSTPAPTSTLTPSPTLTTTPSPATTTTYTPMPSPTTTPSPTPTTTSTPAPTVAPTTESTTTPIVTPEPKPTITPKSNSDSSLNSDIPPNNNED